MSDHLGIIEQLVKQLLSHCEQEFVKVNDKLDRLEATVEDHDRELQLARTLIKGCTAVIVACVPLIIWLWP